MNYKVMKFVLVNGGRWYYRRRYAQSVKVFGALGAVTVLATVAYVIATSNGDGGGAQLEPAGN